MNSLLLLFIFLVLLTLLILGPSGLRNIFGLFLNFSLFFLLVVLINWQLNIILLLVFTSVFMLAISIFFSSDNERVTGIAFKSSLIVVLSLLLLALIVQHFGFFQGYTIDNMDELEGLSLNIGLNFSDVAVVVMVISMLGAVAEAAMAITADLSELIEQSEENMQELTVSELLQHRQIVSQQILGTSINTLFFGMFGATMALIFWYVRLGDSLALVLNSKLLLMEVVSMLLGMIGILLVILLSGHYVVKSFISQKKTDKQFPD
ncbi:MAG: YibE/F family protein [Streptococcaceae bacterium]|jgi:uncharacterized membrane protein|nr:YibE/F family protein [Streptococcaceae bacterium]